MTVALIIFVRNPQVGKVKTRLAATVGAQKALEIYQQLLTHTMDITKDSAAEKYVFYAGEIPETDMWKKAGFRQLLQKEADLGDKMLDAFKTVFSKQHSKVVIIGSDCIELSLSIIQQAFDSLDAHDAVIGPANDGGYYLLGMKKLHEPLFKNKHWSTEGVYAATIQDFHNASLHYFALPTLIDIDTEEDWKEAQQKDRKPVH
jgi:rSAM/selenodomain-associated transferase 1